MKGTFWSNLDIDLYLTLDEFTHASTPEPELVGNKLNRKYETLECKLENDEGSDSGRSANLQFGDFETLGDGIRVDYVRDAHNIRISEHPKNSTSKQEGFFDREGTYFVLINRRASDFIGERGSFGTRYGNGEKITIYISQE